MADARTARAAPSAAAASRGTVAPARKAPPGVHTIKVRMLKKEADSKLGIALENSPPGTYLKVRKVGADGAAAGVLEPGDVIIALDGQPLDVGTAVATELLRSRKGTLVLTVRREMPAEGEEEDDDDESESESAEESESEEEHVADAPDEEETRIREALQELRIKSAAAEADAASDSSLEAAGV